MNTIAGDRRRGTAGPDGGRSAASRRHELRVLLVTRPTSAQLIKHGHASGWNNAITGRHALSSTPGNTVANDLHRQPGRRTRCQLETPAAAGSLFKASGLGDETGGSCVVASTTLASHALDAGRARRYQEARRLLPGVRGSIANRLYPHPACRPDAEARERRIPGFDRGRGSGDFRYVIRSWRSLLWRGGLRFTANYGALTRTDERWRDLATPCIGIMLAPSWPPERFQINPLIKGLQRSGPFFLVYVTVRWWHANAR